MLNHRCPWCGDNVSVTSRYSSRCPTCGKRYRFRYGSAFWLVNLLCIATLFCLPFTKHLPVYWILGTLFFLILPFVVFLDMRVPTEKVEHVDHPIVNPAYVAQFEAQWLPFSESHVLLPRFQVPNGEIFPACFCDEHDVPTSTMWCVMLDEMHWKSGNRCMGRMEFVLPAAPTQLLQPGATFYLFYKAKKIATATLTDVTFA